MSTGHAWVVLENCLEHPCTRKLELNSPSGASYFIGPRGVPGRPNHDFALGLRTSRQTGSSTHKQLNTIVAYEFEVLIGIFLIETTITTGHKN